VNAQTEIAILLKTANQLSANHLPLGGSLVAYELLLNLYLHHSRGEQVTIKALFAGIPYSDMGIRYHLRKLITDGWLELKTAQHDKRTRICVPTPLFERAWLTIMTDLQTAMHRSLLSRQTDTRICDEQPTAPEMG
jgi:DNA-binding MarR family transcriptional regulator